MKGPERETNESFRKGDYTKLGMNGPERETNERFRKEKYTKLGMKGPEIKDLGLEKYRGQEKDAAYRL